MPHNGFRPDRPSVSGYLDWLLSRLGKGSFGLCLVSFVMGAFLSRSFAPVNFFPAVFIAVPVWILLLDRVTSRAEAYVVGWWGGFGLFSVGLTWVGHSFTQQDAVPVFLAPIAIFFLAGLLSIYLGLQFAWCWRFLPKGIWRLIGFAAVWTLFEIIRGVLFTGFPWHLVGSIWAEWEIMVQAARLVSIYGLSFVTVLAAACLAPLMNADWARPRAGACLLLAVFLVGGQFAYGFVRLQGAVVNTHDHVTIRVVQANVLQKEKWLPQLIDDHFGKHLRLSRSNSDKGKADGIKLLVWPETAVQRNSFDREGAVQRWQISQLLEAGSYALTGAPRYEIKDGNVEFYNSLFAVNSNANIYARYDKAHLVPFGEFMPFQSLLEKIGLTQLTGGAAFSSGPGPQTIKLPGVPAFSPLVCYEAIFPGAVLDPSNRPDWLLNISNDGWFGLTEGPSQHLALSRIRAVEEGLPLLRSTSTGISAMIDPYGRTVSALSLNKTAVMDVSLPKAIAAPLLPTHRKILFLAGLMVLVVVIALYGRARVKLNYS